jgi:putative pyruvate formate lyase activating enzyme
MQRQVGELRVGEDGIALAGVLLRHLVLPNDLASTDEVLRFVAEELGQDTAVSLMAQYYPAHLAPRVPLLSRPLRRSEYARAIESLHRLGLSNGFLQDLEAESTYRPDFERPHPFE